MSTKKALKANLKVDFKCGKKSNKEILKMNIQPRISEINHKTNKTYLAEKTWDVLDKEVTVNPFFKNTIKKVICIDSRFRSDYCNTSSTDFVVQLNFNLKNVISMRLESIEVPNTWYMISEKQGNNFFYIILGGTRHKVTIPDGNYNDTSFVIWVNTNPFGAGFPADPPLPAGFLMEVSDKTGKIKISYSTTFDLDFGKTECGDCSFQKTLGWVMGYRNIMYENADNYESEGIFDSGGSRYFYVVVNDFNKNTNDFIIGNLKSSFINKNILAKIPVVMDKFSMLYNEVEGRQTQQRDYFGPVNIERLQIQLLDEYGDIIDLNYMDFSIYLSFKMLY